LYEYEEGNVSKITRFNIKNEVSKESGAQIDDGAAIIKYKYDERGNTISMAYFDKFEKPMISNMGYHLTKFHADKYNNTDEMMYFGLNGNPTTDKKGIHKYYYLYDNLGRNVGEAYYDKQNKPMKDDVNNVFMEKYKYDEDGRMISVSYWSDEKTKMTRWSGIHEYKYTYNKQGQQLETLNLDTEGNLKKSTSGESRWVTEYDKSSRVLAYSIFDGKTPVMMTDAALVSNYHKRAFEYDNQNRTYKIEYFDREGNPVEAVVNRIDKVQKIEIEYQGNNVIRENWYKKGSSIPSKVVDCITFQCMRTSGNGMEYLNR
jgi:type IV secretory pathway TrbF-like protein